MFRNEFHEKVLKKLHAGLLDFCVRFENLPSSVSILMDSSSDYSHNCFKRN